MAEIALVQEIHADRFHPAHLAMCQAPCNKPLDRAVHRFPALLSAAGSAIENFRSLLRTDLGYDPNNIADFSIPVHTTIYATWQGRVNYLRQLRDRVAQTPGVVSTSLGVIGPPYSDWDFKTEILGRTEICNVNFVDAEFFHSLRISLLEGLAQSFFRRCARF